jgi:hypothetical protein
MKRLARMLQAHEGLLHTDFVSKVILSSAPVDGLNH